MERFEEGGEGLEKEHSSQLEGRGSESNIHYNLEDIHSLEDDVKIHENSDRNQETKLLI